MKDARFKVLNAIEAYRQETIASAWNAVLARQTKGKTMLDTSKKYKVGSVVYEWGGLQWIAEKEQGWEMVIRPNAMVQLYDDGLAVEVKEPFEKTFEVEFNRNGNGSSYGPPCLFDFVRHVVGRNAIDTASVANRTFDVTIKERLCSRS